MLLLYKDNLVVKLPHREVGKREIEIIYDFLFTISNVVFMDLISSGLTRFIQNIKNNSISENNLLIPIAGLSNIQLEYFLNYEDKLSDEGFSLFYNCWEEKILETRKVSLRKEALNEMKKEIEKTPEKYFKKFIRTGDSSHPEWNIIAPEPYCKAIFGSYENFEKFLNDCNTASVEEVRVKNYWELYKYNGYYPIEFENQGNVQNKIDNCFRDEIRKLKELLYIKEQIKNNVDVDDELIKKFENNNLYIELRAEILKMLNKFQK